MRDQAALLDTGDGKVSFFNKAKTGKIRKPLFMILYTRPSVGKTDFGASFPRPHFFDFEESTYNLDVSRHRPESWDELMDDLYEIFQRKQITEFQSLIFDTIDEMERLIHNAIADAKKKEFIEDIGFQKGFTLAVTYWAQFISACRAIRDKHNIHFCFLAHATESLKSDRDTGMDYHRYSMSMHKKAADYLFGQVEMVLFAKKEIKFTKKDDRVIAKDSEKRIIYTQLGAIWDAKNRIGLPPQFEMPSKAGFAVIWKAYEKAFYENEGNVYEECKKEIEGVKDETTKAEMLAYIESHKNNLPNLRAARVRIIEVKAGKE